MQPPFTRWSYHPALANGTDSGLAWAEGTPRVDQHRDRKIHQVDPETGTLLHTIESDRFVIGVPAGIGVSGLESDSGSRFFFGGRCAGKLRTIHRPRSVDAVS